jgi:hypothetical protein
MKTLSMAVGGSEMRCMANKEKRFVALCAAALVLASSIPYLAGYFLPFQFSRFNGNLLDDGDFNTYFAFMRQAAAGQWLFHNPLPRNLTNPYSSISSGLPSENGIISLPHYVMCSE